jgi:Glycine/D-amino acid oxidases (deaminating)
VLAQTGIRKFYNGPESFTPDNQFILGEAPECRNFFVGAGFNSVGIATAGGSGRALAEWILTGDPGLDMTANDIRRFARFNGNNRWLHDRVGEVLGLHYAIPWPNRELATARPFRRSPVHHLLAEANACLAAGWAGSARTSSPHRARRRSSSTPGARRTGCPGWPPSSAPPAPAWRCSTRPRSPSTCSPGRAASRRCSGCAPPTWRYRPGGTVYTGMLNERGTYESDLTVTRLSAG